MDTLEHIRIALAETSLGELHALRRASQDSTDLAPGLFAWLEHAASWEIDRRAGHRYVLRGPLEALELSEIPHALLGLAALIVTFQQNHSSGSIVELLRVTAAALKGHSLH